MDIKANGIFVFSSTTYTTFIATLQKELNYYFFTIPYAFIYRNSSVTNELVILYLNYPKTRDVLILGDREYLSSFIKESNKLNMSLNILYFDEDMDYSAFTNLPQSSSIVKYISSYSELHLLNNINIENLHLFYLYKSFQLIDSKSSSVNDESKIMINEDNYSIFPYYLLDIYSDRYNISFSEHVPIYSLIKSSYIPFCFDSGTNETLTISILMNLDMDVLIPSIDTLSIMYNLLINSPVQCIYLYGLNTKTFIPQHVISNLTQYKSQYYYYICPHNFDAVIMDYIPQSSLLFFSSYTPVSESYSNVISTGSLPSQMLLPLFTWFSHHYYREIVIYTSERLMVQVFLKNIKSELSKLYPLTVEYVKSFKKPNPYSFIILLCEPSLLKSLSYTIPTVTTDPTLFYLYMIYELPLLINPEFKIYSLESLLSSVIPHPLKGNIFLRKSTDYYSKMNIFTYEALCYSLIAWSTKDPFNTKEIKDALPTIKLKYVENIEIALNNNYISGKTFAIISLLNSTVKLELNTSYYEDQYKEDDVEDVVFCYVYKIAVSEIDKNQGIYEILTIAIRELNEESIH